MIDTLDVRADKPSARAVHTCAILLKVSTGVWHCVSMWAHQEPARFLPPQGETGIMTVLERISPIFFVLCNGAFLYYLLAVAPGAITADAQGLMLNIIICILLTGVMQLLMHSERMRAASCSPE